MKRNERFLEFETQDGQRRLHLYGDWVIDNSVHILAQMKTLEVEGVPADAIDAAAVGRMDMWGSLTLKDMARAQSAPVFLNDRQKRIFEFLKDLPDAKISSSKRPFLKSAFEDLGRVTIEGVKTAYGMMGFIGQVSICFLKNIARPRGFRFHSIVRHIDETGFRALPIIGLLAVLISMVIAYQAATQLEKFGATIFTIDLTVISLLREMGVLITAIMVAGRSGSAFAAEIGVMKLREETDALKTMGMDPIEILVLPRLMAMMITLPVLAFLADIIGLAGGGIISMTLLDIPLDQYIDRVQSVAKPTMFFVGMIKAPVFAFAITIIGTYQGMNVSGSAESVGRLTTVSVVQSIFLVILLDAFFSILFARMGL